MAMLFISWTFLINPTPGNSAVISGNLDYQGNLSGPIYISINRLSTGNQALTLDGAGDYVIIKDLTDLSGSEITIQYWFRGVSNQSAVRQQSRGWIISGWNNKHVLDNDSSYEGIAVGEAVVDGDWHHVTMTWKQGEADGFASYLDGQFIDFKNAANNPIPSYHAPLFFGSVHGTHEFTDGMLDEIAIWKRALTSEEIAQNWFRKLTGKEDGIIGYWTFDKGEAKDTSPNEYHGFLVGDANIVEAEIPGLDGFHSILMQTTGVYTIENVTAGDNYRLIAFMDVNDNGLREETEPYTDLDGTYFKISEPRTVINLDLQEKPRILNNPTDQRLPPGETIRLSVEASGTPPLQWQWRYNGQNLTDSSQVSGTKTNELIIVNAAGANSGIYNCLVSNNAGSALSQALILQIAEGGLTVSGNITYDGVQSGPIHIKVAQVPPNNQVLTLDGIDDHAVTPLTDLSGSEISIQFWFRGPTAQSAVRQQSYWPNSNSQQIFGYIISAENNKHLLSFDSGTVGISAGGSAITNGNWHQLTMTWKKNTPDGFRSYLDGRLVATRDSVNSEIPNFNNPVYFGCFNGQGLFAKGQLDEIAIWNRALTDKEILVGWNNPLTGDEEGLIGYWVFDDGTGKDLVADNDAVLRDGARIERATIPGFGDAVLKAISDAPGAYAVPRLIPSNYVEVTAYMDVNGNQIHDKTEPQGSYANNPFNLTENVSGIDFTLAEPPTFVDQPADARAISSSTAIEFQAQVSGTAPLAWQWYHNGVELADNAKYDGVHSAKLTVVSPTNDEAGSYSVKVSNSLGEDWSRTAQLSFVNGQTATISGNLSYSGTPPGMIHITATQSIPENRSLKLDGDGDSVIIADLTDLSGTEITIQYWYRGGTFQSPVRQQNGGPFAHWIVSGWDQHQHQHVLSNDGDTSGISAGTGITDGTWNHLTMTWKINTPDGFRSYLNGQPVDQRHSSNEEIPLIGAPLYFGSQNAKSHFLEGELDEIAIWSRALDPEEIQANWNKQLTGDEDDLLGLWKFDDGTPHDSSAFQYKGRLLDDAAIIDAEIPGFGSIIFTDVFDATGTFTMPNLPIGNSYHLSGFVDLNGNYRPDPNEPAINWPDNPFQLDQDLSNLSFDFGSRPSSVNLSIMLEGDTVTISWPKIANGAVLYQKEALTEGEWSVIEHITDNQAELPINQKVRFFQLRFFQLR